MQPQTTQIKRVLVVGIDCATPQFIFGPDRFDLPNLQALAQRGCYGLLRSSDPPITVPAWACMMSGKDAGALGCYGFRNRKDYSYDAMFTANASAIREKRVWDILSRAGKRVIILGVPQTYPVRPVNGCLVAGFLTPNTDAEYTYPKPLKHELREAVGEYIIDVKDFRTDDKHALLKRLYDLLENRFAYARYLMEHKPWDFFMMVEMGVDRLHHGFWRFCDPAHPRYEPGNSFENAIRDYYKALDDQIGRLVELAGRGTAILAVSDHGARTMLGGVCVNQWLINEGLLVLNHAPDSPTRLEDCDVNWAKTKAWSSGGYYARVFVNVEGREPQGTVPASEYEAFRDDLAAKLEAMRDHEGRPLHNKVLKPQDIYRTVNGVAPDLFVYFGDLAWRSVGSVGYDSVYTFENDTGPDDANHDYNGIFIMDDGRARNGQELQGLNLMDVAPTILDRLSVPVPDDMQGNVIR